MISIFDYGAGNLRSVQNTLAEIGAPHRVIDDAHALRQATKLILPGVGHFGQMMRMLDAMRVREAILERLRAGVPFLGICLGMQALFERSEEAPEVAGLGLFPGTVQRFTGGLRVPHMGWSDVAPRKESRLLEGIGARPFLYFAHSFYCPLVEATAGVCEYGVTYTAVLEHENLFGVQFHPEKSGPLGLQVIRNFARLEHANVG